jgi:pyrroline-5-carboxylate reductase
MRACATPILPPNPLVKQIFDACGAALEVTDESVFDAYVAGSAIMASYFGIAKTVADWMAAHGVDPADADHYVRTLFGNLGDTMRKQTGLSFDQLREDHTTKGGLNEMVHKLFMAEGGGKALTGGLDAVLARVRA